MRGLNGNGVREAMVQSAEFLNQIDIFSLLSPEEIDRIISLFRSHEIDEGRILFREGDEGNELFIVMSGVMASSIRLMDGSQREIAAFHAGNFFGDMSIFEKAPRSATCYCKKKSVLLSLHEKDFYRMIELHPEIATKIMYRMLNITTQRLRDTGEFLSDMVHWGEAARRRAITDGLTGAYNRRFLDDALESRFEMSRNRAESFTMIMVDLDYFRNVNESYGNEAGDKAIIEVVHVINRHLGEHDVLARFGGDEFTILMPGTDCAAACGISEKIRAEVESLDILKSYGGPMSRMTLSIGIASYPEHARSVQEIKEAADHALYRAKEGGRNRVVCGPDSPVGFEER
jgi:diguanylate cyclase (GGDEF)-like protein